MSINRIYLYEKNPRHEEVLSQADAIAALCGREQVLPLARDIVDNGLNPLEHLGVFPIDPPAKTPSRQKYWAAEGNRRLCALKLLNDPDLAPGKFKRSFRALANKWNVPIKSLNVVFFSSFDESRIWLERIHGSELHGVSRRKWTTEQKSRFDDKNKNRSAQELLDYMQSQGLISEDDRKRKITTVERFISNPKFRDALGIDRSDPETLSRNRPTPAFNGLVQRFANDLADGAGANSRMNKNDIEQYADDLVKQTKTGNDRIDATPLVAPSQKKSATRKTRPMAQKKVPNITHSKEIEQALEDYGNAKLRSLYYSITMVGLEHHAPLIAVGIWAFVETLSACAGRNAPTDFVAYLNKSRLENWGFTINDSKTIRDVLQRFADFGNSTKHHPTSAAFNGEQMNNDMVTTSTLILKCIEEAKAKP